MKSEAENAEVTYERALEIKKTYEKELLAKANVVGVGVGMRQKEGKLTERIAIVVLVKEKFSYEMIKSEDVIPQEIEGVPVDVQPVGQMGKQIAHTYSVIGRDSETGQMGVAVQSHYFSVGSVVPWAEAGVGVVATQAHVEVSYGPLGLALMREGKTAEEALAALLTVDKDGDRRQVAMLDSKGSISAHTGKLCIEHAGYEIGDDFAVQANMMLKPTVWGAMAVAYRSADGDLANKLLSAMAAAQVEGGDIRGMQSAAILIVTGEKQTNSYEGVIMDLRVEDHPNPVRELERLVGMKRAYQLNLKGDELLVEGKIEEALLRYQQAMEGAPDLIELSFWYAVTLAELGRDKEAAKIFSGLFRQDPNWAELLKRLPLSGLLRKDPEMMSVLLGEK